MADKLKEQTGDLKLGAGDLKKMSDIITKMGRGFKIPGSVDKKEKREKLEKFSKVEFMGFGFFFQLVSPFCHAFNPCYYLLTAGIDPLCFRITHIKG